jgi:tetratricopeptide (TPR) repeat protein
MKSAISDSKVTQDSFQEFASIITGNDDYWIEQNNNQGLPRGIEALKKIINSTDCSLSKLATEIKRWNTPTLIYTPEPCLKDLYQMILEAEQGKMPSQKLSILKKTQCQYAELKTKLEANQTVLDKAVSAQDNAMIAEAYKERGLLYLNGNKMRYGREALACFNQAILLKAEPKVTAFCLRKRGALYLADGQTEVGIDDLSEACKLVSDNPEAWFEYGEALISLNQYEKAIEPLKKALTLRPSSYKTQTLLKDAMTQGRLSRDTVQSIEALLAVGHTLEALNAQTQERHQLPLWLKAAQLGDRGLMAYLAPQLDTQVQDEAGNTALHYAARLGHVHLLELLKKYLDLNMKNTSGLTPLLVAIQAGKTVMVEALIEAGANSKGALLMAVETGQGCVFEALHRLQLLDNQTMALFQKAIETKQLSMLKMLLQYYPDVFSSIEAETLLHMTIRMQFEAGMHYLIDRGIDLKQTAETVAIQVAPSYQAAIANARAQRRRLEQQRVHLEQELVQNLQADFPLFKDAENIKKFLQILNEVLHPKTLNPEFSQFLVKNLIQHKTQVTKSGTVFGDKLKRDALRKILSTLLNNWQQPPALIEERSALPTEGLSQVSTAFCERFEKQLDEAYGYFRAVASGELVSGEDQKHFSEARAVAMALPNVGVQGMNVPSSLLALGALELAGYLRQRYSRHKAERLTQIFKAVTPYERTHFIRYTAEQLADKYHDQIHHLMPTSEGVELFADCAAARVIEYITSSERHQIAFDPSFFSNLVRSMKSWATGKEIPPEQREQKNLYQLFIDGIIRVSSKFPQDKERLKTINHLTLTDNWNTKGIFENTGIITSDQQRYAHPNVDIERYGYCRGTAQEAERRDLSLQQKNKLPWGKGRVWEVVEQNQRLEPLPGRPLLADFERQAQSVQQPVNLVVGRRQIQFGAPL